MKTYNMAAAFLTVVIGMGFVVSDALADPGHPRVNEVNARLENQGDRIHNGVKSGALSANQARRLKLNDAKIRYQEQRDRIDANGHLTKSEDRTLNRELNKNSAAIARDKHS